MPYSEMTGRIMRVAGGALWRMPGRFGIANLAFPSYSLRCLVFHNVSPTRSPFTDGMKVSVTPDEFEMALRYLAAHYDPVSLEDVLSNSSRLAKRPVLVTFDDAYASVAEHAAGLCRQFKVPALFLVNGAFVDNRCLAPDNLVCYVFNMFGKAMINAAAQKVSRYKGGDLQNLSDVFERFFPAISLAGRDAFLGALKDLSGIGEQEMAKETKLYVTSEQLRNLKDYNFEIGSHTYTHPYCRSLSRSDFSSEIDRNRLELSALTGQQIRSFSLPYGSARDLTGDLAAHLEASGYKAVFLSESVANQRGGNPFHLDRVSSCAANEEMLFCDLEILPRLRAQRNRLLRRSGSHKGSQMKPPNTAGETLSLNEHIEAANGREMRA